MGETLSGAPLFHLHVPKTAGTALRSAYERAGHKILLVDSSFVYDPAKHADVAFFSGHAGFRAVDASPALRGRAITVVRDPYERLLSYYYHLVKQHREGKEDTHRVVMAAKYGPSDFFAMRDDPHLANDVYNAMTWQLAYDGGVHARMAYRDREPPFTAADLVGRAKANLSSCLAVGLQSQMGAFVAKLQRETGVDLRIGSENTNPDRLTLPPIDAQTRRRLRDWIELDLEVYEWALTALGQE